MKLGYIIVIVLLLLSASFFGAYFGTQKEKVVEKIVVKEVTVFVGENKVSVEPTTTELPIPTPTVISKTSKYGYGTTPYGGIPGTKDKPPNGAVVNNKLSNDYKRPVAVTPDGVVYYFVGSWGWFTQKEVAAMPLDMFKYDESPYTWYD